MPDFACEICYTEYYFGYSEIFYLNEKVFCIFAFTMMMINMLMYSSNHDDYKYADIFL